MNRERELNIRERVFKAFSDLIILRAIAEKPMTGYRIIRLCHKKHGILPNSSMIYSCLKNIENKKWIKLLPIKDGKTYSLTPRGKRIINNMNVVTQEIRDAVRTMIEN
jgi:DNA-binding PadR family transcriptional regulator